MAVTGRRPKPHGQAINRNRPIHGWCEVPNEPFQAGPALPPRCRNGRGWPQYARERWRVWSQMPHAALWTETDWQFALDALELVIRCTAEDSPVSAWAELRIREKVMLTTWDARQSARLRYAPASSEDGPSATLSDLASYRDL